MPDAISSATGAGSDVTATQQKWNTERAVTGAGNASMDIADFYKLLAAQLKYQDMDNPMDTSEMMGQMVQTQMVQVISEMSQMNYITYAASMMGKEVTMAEIDSKGNYLDELTTGTVSGVGIGDNPPTLYINGKRYSMNQLVCLGKLPKDTVETPSEEEDEEEPPVDEVEGSENKQPQDSVNGEENGTQEPSDTTAGDAVTKPVDPTEGDTADKQPGDSTTESLGSGETAKPTEPETSGG